MKPSTFAGKGPFTPLPLIKLEARNGLLYEVGKPEDIPLPYADFLAALHGFVYAERLVAHLTKGDR